MGGQNATVLAQSYCDWWSLAGVDALVGETPAGWLAPASITQPAARSALADPAAAETLPLPAALRPQPQSAPAAPKGPVEFPGDWGEFRQWLATSEDVPGSQWDAARVLPSGEAGAALMLLTAWPEIEDQREAALFSGPAGQLLDAMLRAISLERSDCYMASLAVTRPPGGRCDRQDLEALDRLLWHHLALARPKRLLLIGADAARMATGAPLAAARGRLLDLNQDGPIKAVTAIAHPATILARPAQKAAAWDSLKLLNRGG